MISLCFLLGQTRVSQIQHFENWSSSIYSLKNESFLQMIFDNNAIQFVEDHIHLGINFSQNDQRQTYIEHFANTASKILGIVCKLKYTMSRNALTQIYLYHLLPIIEYD